MASFFFCSPCFFDGRFMGKLLVYNKFMQSYSQLNIISKGSPVIALNYKAAIPSDPLGLFRIFTCSFWNGQNSDLKP